MPIHDIVARRLNGEERDLSEFRGQVLLIVNVASRCGFTPQYAGLEALYRKLHARGLTVLGFPCNQFGSQEPGDEAQIGSFCDASFIASRAVFSSTPSIS